MTLTCAALVERVTAYLEGALALDAERRFEHHVAECLGCATYVDQSRETVRLVGLLQPEGVPASTRDDLLGVFRALHARHP